MSRNSIQTYMKEHMPLYIFVSVLFVMGVIFGALMVNALSLEQREDLTRFLGSFVASLGEASELHPKETFVSLFGMHMKWIMLIWLLGISVIGLPIILVLDFLKGVMVGFTVGYLVGELSWKGMLFALVSVAPQNLVIIPTLIIVSVSGISFSLYMVRNRILQRRGALAEPFMSYSVLTLSMAAVLLGTSLFEAYVSPTLMQWVTPMIALTQS
ncbi:stage II sporulation protein M [Paenibacillus swuensis]|uniref:Stage II sporulation protein M n=1 Tax=Paenibacillus swuensis TaxID=1178515 RepID=A0A172TLV9_9BACL|nr:stage II sporulation protein M [Paenibacillus swuensis]ANE48031.1 stage II sporulation protein M [Paenibacillus swuensis]